MAHFSGAVVEAEYETLQLPRGEAEWWRFHVPLVRLCAADFADVALDDI